MQSLVQGCDDRTRAAMRSSGRQITASNVSLAKDGPLLKLGRQAIVSSRAINNARTEPRDGGPPVPHRTISLACPRCGADEAVRIATGASDLTLACDACGHVIEAETVVGLLDPKLVDELKARLEAWRMANRRPA